MQNTSGIHPVEYMVLVLPDPVEERTKGGLIRPETTKEKEEFASVRGVLVEASKLAFSELPRIQEGSRVLFKRYAGTTVEGDDGKKYMVMKDKDIVGVLE